MHYQVVGVKGSSKDSGCGGSEKREPVKRNRRKFLGNLVEGKAQSPCYSPEPPPQAVPLVKEEINEVLNGNGDPQISGLVSPTSTQDITLSLSSTSESSSLLIQSDMKMDDNCYGDEVPSSSDLDEIPIGQLYPDCDWVPELNLDDIDDNLIENLI